MGRLGMGDFERAVLLAILHLRGQGYAVSIADEIERRTGKSVSLGAIYATVDRLQSKGFISSRMGKATRERGGKRKRHYRIDALGERALDDARDANERMWASAPPLGETA
jgi:PadR family transcriptional regulator, regulatory protein PadR